MADKTLPPIAIGDSLAQGMRDANQLSGLSRVGAGPKEVLEMLQRFSAENSLSGRDVFIGTGMPNIPEQKKFIEQQIDFVKKQGGNPILIGVGPGTKSKPTTGQNEFLASLAERKGLSYMGPLQNMFPEVAKDPMGLHLRSSQYKQLFKQYSKPSQAKPQTQQVQPQVSPASRAPSASDLLNRFTGAVMEAESKGQRYDKSGKLLTSKAGALGEMQVMPKTVTDPGFGVKPARDMSPGEIARVGRDYAAVMLKRFNNDPTAAAVAYNWGPGNADKWVKRGADFNQLPKETQNYVTRITGQMGVPIAAKRAPAQKRVEVPPVPPTKRVSTPSVPRAEAEIDYAPGSTLETASRPADQGQGQDVVTRADVERLGPNYQAALATMALVDSQEDDEWDDDETIAERYMERRGEQLAREESTLEEEPARPSPLANLELSYESPFPKEQSPVRLAHGGIVHRAEGSPIYGEGFDTGPVTADTRAALSNRQSFNPREALAALKRIGGEGVSNLESMARRSVATVPGVVGDIESIFRDDKSRKFATSEEVDRQYLPKRMTTPTKESEGYAAIGEFIDPTMIALKAAPKTAKATLKALKESGPQVEAALMKAAPVAQPMGVIPESQKMLMETPETSLFVSKVDDFIASQKNPVTKQQLLGQMKGKFRDYEIGRVSAALADLPDTARIMPNDLLTKVQSSYPTSSLKTYVLEPQKVDRWSTMDNVYTDQPVGVVNLRFDTPMENVYKAAASQEALNRLSWITNPISFNTSSMKAQDLVDLSGAIKNLPNADRFKNLTTELDNFYSIKSKSDDSLAKIEKAVAAYKYPATIDGWSEAINDYYKKTRNYKFEDAREYANKFVQKEADKTLKDFGIPIPKKSLDPAEFINELSANGAKKMQSISEAQQDVLLELNSKYRPAMEEAVKEFKKTAIYEGQHKSLTPKGEPIAFSRFVDHTTNIPGRGETKVMHMIELQSDLLDDIFKKGPRSGSKEKDAQELKKLQSSIQSISEGNENIKRATKALDDIRSRYYSASNAERSDAYKKIINQNPDIEKQLIEHLKLRDRESKLNIRSRLGDYSIREVFAGMEGSPQVTQQMMIKNAIGAAMQRGVNAVTFPGKESKQAQLYEKLYPNLKQAVKDLGPGFDIQQIQLYDSLGNPYSHWGVVWDDSTANKVLKTGIRFNKGGLVEKQDTDNRKFI